MLEIYINKQKVDISEDTSISLNYANPFVSSDEIPTPYSFSFDLPRTSNNLNLFGNPHRVAANRSNKTISAKIRYDGVALSEGMITVGSVTKDSIDVNFNSSNILAKFKKYLHEQDLGRISFGTATLVDNSGTDRPNAGRHWDTTLPFASYKKYWDDQALADSPSVVAPPMAIKGAKWDPGDPLIERPFTNSSTINQRRSRINNYNKQGYVSCGFFSKILPAIQVGYIFGKIDANLAAGFAAAKLQQLMLVTAFHPSYQTNDDSPVWNCNDATGECYVDLADFVPKINTGEFVAEILKLICASIFLVGDKITVATREDILNSPDSLNWSGKIIGTPSLELRPGENYSVSYQDVETADPLPAERVIETIDSVSSIVSRTAQNAVIENKLKTYKVSATNQIFEMKINGLLSNETHAHYDYALAQNQQTIDDNSEETSNEFSVEINAAPVKMVVATDMLNDVAMVPSFSQAGATNHNYIYCPEIEIPDKTRPETLILGTYFGRRSAIMPPWFDYPFLTSNNCDADGIFSSNNVSLELGGERGLINVYHNRFKKWVEKNKLVLTADVLLSPIDLKNLDLRRKIHLRGRNFFIEELSVTIKSRSIEPAEVTFVEV